MIGAALGAALALLYLALRGRQKSAPREPPEEQKPAKPEGVAEWYERRNSDPLAALRAPRPPGELPPRGGEIWRP